MTGGLSDDDSLSVGLKVDGLSAIFASIVMALSYSLADLGLNLSDAVSGIIATVSAGLIYILFLKKRNNAANIARLENEILRNRLQEEFTDQISDTSHEQIGSEWKKIRTKIAESKLTERNQRILTSRLEELIPAEYPKNEQADVGGVQEQMLNISMRYTDLLVEEKLKRKHSELIDRYQEMELALEKSLEKIQDFETEKQEQSRKNSATEAIRIATELQSTGLEIDAEKAIQLGSAAELSGMIDIAEGYFKQGLKLFRLDENSAGEARALNHLGNLCRIVGYYSGARDNYNSSLEIFESIGDMTGISHSLHLIGNCEWERGNLDECADFYSRSLEIRREHCSDEEIGKTLLNLGSLHARKKELSKAEKFYMEGLQFFTNAIKHGEVDYILVGAALNNLGHLKHEQGENIMARMHHNEALRLFEENGFASGVAKCLNNLGSVEFSDGEYKDAEDYYIRSLKIRIKLGDQAGEALVKFNIGEIKLHLGEIEDSLRFYKESLQMYLDLGIPVPEWFSKNGYHDVDSDWEFPPNEEE